MSELNDSNLKERLTEIFNEHDPECDLFQYHKNFQSVIINCMTAAYNLDRDIQKSQAELLESMGETNKQLAKRLGAIHNIMLSTTPSEEGFGKIWDILIPNPPQS
jgi:hypothetical protein